jgi:hypothetical protein
MIGGILYMGDKKPKKKEKKKNMATKKDPNIPTTAETPPKHL